MIIFVKDEDDVLVIPVGLGPNVGEQECPEPVMEDITLDSSTAEQTVTPGEGVDGFSGVTVNPYILDTKTVDSSIVSQTVTSDEDGLSQVTVNPYTTETRTEEITTNGTFVYTPVTADALSQVTVDVSINTVNNQSKTVDSSTVSQNVTPDTGYTGLGNVTVNPYILDTKTVDPSTSQITVNSSADGLSGVTVTAVNSGIDQNITSGNIKSGVSILGVTGSYSGEPANLQDVSLSYTQNGSYTVSSSSGYDGLGTVDIDVSVSGGGGGDWVIAARKGGITDIRGYSYDGLLDTSYGGYYMFYGNGTVTAMSTDTSTIGYYGMQRMFAESTALTTVDLSSVRTVNEYGMGNAFLNCSSLTGTLDLRNVQSVGIGGFYSAFSNTRITTVYMPKMKDIPNNAFRSMFYNDSSLEHIYMDFSELETIGDYGTYDITADAAINLGNDNTPDFPELKTIGTFGGTGGGVALDFSNSPNVTYISFPKLETVNGEIRFQNCTNLTGDVSFPELVSCGGIRYNFRYAFTNTGITSLTFNKLTGLGGSYFGHYMCQGCPNLTTVSFPELTAIGNSGFGSYAFADCSSLTTVSFPKVSYMTSNSIGQYMFQNCPNLVNFEAHPTFFRYTNSYGNQFFSTVRNLTLTANIVADLRLDYMQNLTADSVLNVLQHCDDTPGTIGTRNIYFYTGGLTVTDYPDGRIQAAYDAAVGPHANATFVINRLTIVPYS